jgi:serine/threonine-protein phosphatase 2A regulatory subunit B''
MRLGAFWGIKVDQIFTDWLTDTSNSTIFNAIRDASDAISRGVHIDFDLSVFDTLTHDQPATARLRPPTMSGSSSGIHAIAAPSAVDGTESVRPLSAGRDGRSIPTFFASAPNDVEKEKVDLLAGLPLDRIEELFETYCRLPACFAPVFLSLRSFTPEGFVVYWKEHFLGRPPNDRLLRLLVEPPRLTIEPQDLVPYVTTIAQQHQSLQFLQDEPVFFSRYVEFAAMRLFFILDPELRGTAGIRQFRRVDLAGRLFALAHMADINEPTSLFNYQHFYVTFCKFWDLDADGDGFLTRDDLLKFNEGALSVLVCDRFINFQYAPLSFTPKRRVDFRAFAYLLLCTEDNTNQTSINFWFRICDLDDDDVLSLHEIGRLYQEQLERMAATGNETIPFNDISMQLIDAIGAANPGALTLQDLVDSRQAAMFFDFLVDLQKFLYHEYHTPVFDAEVSALAAKLTPWELYALAEYEALIHESG